MTNYMSTQGLSILLLTGFLVGCALSPKIPLDIGANPPARFAWNISAEDLVNPATSSTRLAIYLNELSAAGYSKEIRIILPPDWGPLIYEHWFPVIRAKGYKVLAILAQSRNDSAAMPERALTWARHILPLVRQDLIGVQIVNEPGLFYNDLAEYLAWHRQMVPIVRELVPGIPIVAVDGFGHDGWNAWTRHEQLWALGFASGTDYDIMSLHLTGEESESWLKDLAGKLRTRFPGLRTWITEGDWGHLAWLNAHGVYVEKDFIYSWNAADSQNTRRPGGILP